jgi:hypothetical protein
MKLFFVISDVANTIAGMVFFTLALIAWFYVNHRKITSPAFDTVLWWFMFTFIITALMYIAGKIIYRFQP